MRVYIYIYIYICACVQAGIDGCADGWMDAWMDGMGWDWIGLDKWMDGWTDGQMEWMVGCMCVHAYGYVYNPPYFFSVFVMCVHT